MNVKVGGHILFVPVPIPKEARPKGGVPAPPKRSLLHYSLATSSEPFLRFLSPTHRTPSVASLAFRLMLWVSSKGSGCRP